MMKNPDLIERLKEGNRRYAAGESTLGDCSPEARACTTENGQSPYAIVICCSDSRVIPEVLFSAGIGDLFVIRVAGNVLDNHQLGSIEYAAAHLGCRVVLMLGHTHCGAIHATLSGGGDGYIQYITDEIRLAVGNTKDERIACQKNVEHAEEIIRHAFADHPEIPSGNLDVVGAIYDIRTGRVQWLDA